MFTVSILILSSLFLRKGFLQGLGVLHLAIATQPTWFILHSSQRIVVSVIPRNYESLTIMFLVYLETPDQLWFPVAFPRARSMLPLAVCHHFQIPQYAHLVATSQRRVRGFHPSGLKLRTVDWVGDFTPRPLPESIALTNRSPNRQNRGTVWWSVCDLKRWVSKTKIEFKYYYTTGMPYICATEQELF